MLFVLFVEAQRYILEQIDQGATTGQLVSSQGVFRQQFRCSSRQIDERSEQREVVGGLIHREKRSWSI